MQTIERMSAWIEEVYLPKLRYRNNELLFDKQSSQTSSERFSEHFLQVLWNERYILPDVRTVSGQTIQIIHQGTWNVSAGPDFHDAALVIDGKPLHGDVEIHQRTSDWRHHGHSGDPRYNNVILHVVWDNDQDIPEIGAETLVLKDNLPPEWHILLQDVEDAAYSYARQVGTGQCAVRWASADDEMIRGILASAGLARLALKGSRIQRLCSIRGTDQALYELYFECLGYHSNRQAMRSLAENVPLEHLRGLPSAEEDLAPYLFASAGLLPDCTQDAVCVERLSEVADLWKRHWELGGEILELPWTRGQFRPLNSPHRRLAAGIDWLYNCSFRPRDWLLKCANACHSAKELLKKLMETPCNSIGKVWEGYRDFKTPLRVAAKLMGEARQKDIVANLYLPYLCSLETNYGDTASGVADLARETFVILSTGQDNRVLTEAIHRFLSPPTRAHDLLKRYCHQQGLIDIYANFCKVLNCDCTSCPFAFHG